MSIQPVVPKLESSTDNTDKPSNLPDRLKNLKDKIDNIVANGRTWPQVTKGVPNIKQGFLPPILVYPLQDYTPITTGIKYDSAGDFITSERLVSKKFGDYEFTDWRGFSISDNNKKLEGNGAVHKLDTEDRFNETKSNFPKVKNGITDYGSLKSSPYSTRDFYLLFNDNLTDYFKHGLQIIDGLNPIENPTGENGGVGGASDLRKSQFPGTPFENNDPVIFGFEIIIDVVASPLFNGAIPEFLTAFSGVSELKSKIPVYQDFKHQFIKLFKTNISLKVESDENMISKNKTNYANTESQKNIYSSGRKAYMGYYLKKVGGLDKLIEANTSGANDSKKYLVDYRKDLIDLEFTEDVSLSIGTLAHLYKLLYWSKPNGKSLVPENLLRFNCDIIVSECRNFTRVRKSIETGDLEVIKDNVSRYIYSLKECQLFFNTMPHNAEIDLSSIATYDTYSVKFDYKYSTSKFERFVPTTNGFGQYVGYDSGAIWKPTTTKGSTQSTIVSSPSFRTINDSNRSTKYLYTKNGLAKALVLEFFGKVPDDKPLPIKFTKPPITDEEPEAPPTIDDLKSDSKKSGDEAAAAEKAKSDKEIIGDDGSKDAKNTTQADSKFKEFVKNLENSGKSQLNKSLSDIVKKGPGTAKNFIDRLKEKTVSNVKVQIANLVNNRVNLLSRTINKLGIGFVGGKGIRPPKNVYTPDQGALGNALTNVTDRFFYDIRNELTDFAGGALSNFLNSASYKKK